MKKLIEKAFFDRNTDSGLDRFLSGLGFDLGLGYTLQPGPTKKFVYAVENEPPKKDVKARMKASMKKIKASRSK